jgi:DNA polymerase-3 subunit gamma/tau
MDEPQTPAAPHAGAAAYRVLARKYRPWSFDDLIGQDAMVKTLTNAFSSGRIAQAWMLTGVRGVGKTTTARILARALNYELDDGSITGPTIQMPQPGIHCAAIMESRHIDVLEMDAASRTGIDDVREILDGVRYAPAAARYKVYIIDEVHMLSDKAFNAFLKTLEEPPPHVKFVFATTEIRKVPVTVLSRCQRFSLRRVDAATLMRHLAGIAEREGVAAEDEALALVARAAEGSVRDALSILDQAIAHGGGRVEAAALRQMLGLSDRGRIVDLFAAAMAGDAAGALATFRDIHDDGADAAIVLADLADYVHYVTRVKLSEAALADPSATEVERSRAKDFAAGLSHRVLARALQMLLKGIAEVQAAPKPAQAADMVLVRLAYAADLPTPDEALRVLADGQGDAASSPSSPPPRAAMAGGGVATAAYPRTAAVPQAQPAPAAAPRLERFEDVVALAGTHRDVGLKAALERDVHLVAFEDGKIEFRPAAGAARGLSAEIQRKLMGWTGRRWSVVVSSEEGEETLRAQAEAAAASRRRGIAAHPDVQAVLEKFPGAEIIDVRVLPPADVTAMPEEPDEESEPDA